MVVCNRFGGGGSSYMTLPTFYFNLTNFKLLLRIIASSGGDNNVVNGI